MDTVQRQHLMRSLPWHILCCSIHSNRCSEWRTDWLKLDTTSTNNKNTRQTRAVTSSSNLFSWSQKNVPRNNKLQSDPIESLLSSIPVPFPQLIDSSRKLNSRCGTTFKWTTDPPGLMNGKEFQISCDSIQFVDPLQRAHLLNATGSLSSSLWRGSFSSLSWDNLIDRSRIAADPSKLSVCGGFPSFVWLTRLVSSWGSFDYRLKSSSARRELSSHRWPWEWLRIP